MDLSHHLAVEQQDLSALHPENQATFGGTLFFTGNVLWISRYF